MPEQAFPLTGIGSRIKANHLEGQAKLRLIRANCRLRFLLLVQLDKCAEKELLRDVLNGDIRDEWSSFSLGACCSSETKLIAAQSKPRTCSTDTTQV